MQGCLYVRQANTTIHEAIHRIAGFEGAYVSCIYPEPSSHLSRACQKRNGLCSVKEIGPDD